MHASVAVVAPTGGAWPPAMRGTLTDPRRSSRRTPVSTRYAGSSAPSRRGRVATARSSSARTSTSPARRTSTACAASTAPADSARLMTCPVSKRARDGTQSGTSSRSASRAAGPSAVPPSARTQTCCAERESAHIESAQLKPASCAGPLPLPIPRCTVRANCRGPSQLPPRRTRYLAWPVPGWPHTSPQDGAVHAHPSPRRPGPALSTGPRSTPAARCPVRHRAAPWGVAAITAGPAEERAQ